VKLDRETAKEYEVPIMASDYGGRPAFITIRVKVADENDNAPVFLLKEYKAAIHSNFTVALPFLKVCILKFDH
jgi:protocadherin Fat 1/2/3